VDDTEYWTINSFKGTNLLQTMVHELGHSLGLSHSDMRSAIMAPFYKGWDPNMKLDGDDVKAIQALYGEKAAKPSPKVRIDSLRICTMYGALKPLSSRSSPHRPLYRGSTSPQVVGTLQRRVRVTIGVRERGMFPPLQTSLR
jgi:hypothetical protein